MANLKFYTDEHVDLRIVKQLRGRGVDIISAGEVGMLNAQDVDHLNYATHEERVVLTCDQDFPRLNDAWLAAGKAHAGIAFMTQDVCNDIGLAVRVLSFWHEAVQQGAATVAEDFYNQLNYVRE